MNAFNARREQIRESRALLLDFVNAVYPSSIPEGQLLDVMLGLDEPVANEFVERDLGYLEARGLIAPQIVDHPVVKGRRVKRWTLTAEGVTFLERDKPWSDLEGG